MSGETTGPIVFVAGLAVFVATVLVVVTGHLGDVAVWILDVAVWILGVELLRQVGTWVAVAGVVGLFGWGIAHGAENHGTIPADARLSRGTLSPSERRNTETHEKRHLKAARALGAGGEWGIDENGEGWFQRKNAGHLSPVEHAAISLAGNGGSWWAGSPCDKQDEANAKGYLTAYPPRERPARLSEARALARRLS